MDDHWSHSQEAEQGECAGRAWRNGCMHAEAAASLQPAGQAQRQGSLQQARMVKGALPDTPQRCPPPHPAPSSPAPRRPCPAAPPTPATTSAPCGTVDGWQGGALTLRMPGCWLCLLSTHTAAHCCHAGLPGGLTQLQQHGWAAGQPGRLAQLQRCSRTAGRPGRRAGGQAGCQLTGR